ncbi:lytic transglycosylase domain-containing protein [Barnesiella intestinihominis]|uniref:lytic transglycosylase domain-containing protein n=1 Tax=Barnesiella intestinihominis TaxID=487174 RepID=UPI003AB6419C
MTSNRYFFIVLLFLYIPLFIKGYANTTKEFSDVIVPEFPLQVKFANELVDLDRLDMYERFDRELTTLCYMHSSTSLAIKRANRYFPILEPILKEEKVPTDFLYLAVIESTLNPRAVSPAKAVGIWQIMPRTGREYGLEVNNDIDERYHIEKSTRAACKYLKDAYEKYGSWTTVAASYNAGRTYIDRIGKTAGRSIVRFMVERRNISLCISHFSHERNIFFSGKIRI